MSKLVDKIPEQFIIKMAEAMNNDHLGIVVVVSHEAMANLKQDRPSLLEIENGDIIILVTQAAMEEIYTKE